jgi:hypothetical protein
MAPKWREKKCFLAIILGEMVQNNHKTGIYAPLWGHMGLNEPKKVPKGRQVGGIYGQMYDLKIKPLPKLLGPFF